MRQDGILHDALHDRSNDIFPALICVRCVSFNVRFFDRLDCGSMRVSDRIDVYEAHMLGIDKSKGNIFFPDVVLEYG